MNAFYCGNCFIARYGNNATKLLKASSDDGNLLKQFVSYLVEDITCYEKELEAFQKVVPVNPFTGRYIN